MKKVLLLTLLSLAPLTAHAQTAHPAPKESELYRTIAKLDAELFDAYDRCNLERFGSFFVDDVEFYHDQGGLTLGRKELVESVRKNICGKVTRELLPATLQVYPMKDGALEVGFHRFHHPGHDDTEGVGEGQFIHLWQKKDGVWKIIRVISFDHHTAGK
jgi:ketosteroid isomerase-like protein